MLVYGCAADGQVAALAYDFCEPADHDYAAARAMIPFKANQGTARLDTARLRR